MTAAAPLFRPLGVSPASGLGIVLLVAWILVPSAPAGVVLGRPGWYEVTGAYLRHADGCLHLAVAPGTRSEHVVRIAWPADPEWVPGLRVRLRVRATEPGDPAKILFTPGATPPVILPWTADLWGDFWRVAPELPAAVD